MVVHCSRAVISKASYARNSTIRQTTLEMVWKWSEAIWQNYSDDAKRFIFCLLQPKPEDRPFAEDAKDERWLQDEIRE